MESHPEPHVRKGGRAGFAADPPAPRDPEFVAGASKSKPDDRFAALEVVPEWAPRAGRRTFREKFGAGLNGLKHAFRGDSSFFAHAYRWLLIALTGALLGIGPTSWCLLILSIGMIFIAELGHSAVDTLARVIGDPDEPRLKSAREIATAGVLVAYISLIATSAIVLSLKLGEQLGWW